MKFSTKKLSSPNQPQTPPTPYGGKGRLVHANWANAHKASGNWLRQVWPIKGLCTPTSPTQSGGSTAGKTLATEGWAKAHIFGKANSPTPIHRLGVASPSAIKRLYLAKPIRRCWIGSLWGKIKNFSISVNNLIPVTLSEYENYFLLACIVT